MEIHEINNNEDCQNCIYLIETKDKVVKCRKEHMCNSCCEPIEINCYARSVIFNIDGKLREDYICEKCCIEFFSSISEYLDYLKK